MGNYFNIDTKFRGSNDVEMIVNPAKSQQFGSGLTDLEALKAHIKATFYLDEIMGFKANYGGTDYHGFWGLVKAGSFNESMHKATRILEIHGDTFGNSLRMLNDAGLNTYGIAYAIYAELETGLVKANITDSFLNPTTAVTLYWRVVPGGSWQTPIPMEYAAGTTWRVPTDNTDIPMDEDIEAYAGVTNSEGTRTVDTELYNFHTSPDSMTVLVSIAQATWVSGDGIYVDFVLEYNTSTPGTIVITLNFSDSTSTTVNIYADGNSSHNYQTALVAKSGTPSSINVSIYNVDSYDADFRPGTQEPTTATVSIDSTPRSFLYNGYGSTQAEAHEDAFNSTTGTSRIYRKHGTSNWYYESNYVTLAATGWYSYWDGSTYTDFNLT